MIAKSRKFRLVGELSRFVQQYARKAGATEPTTGSTIANWKRK